MIVFELKATQIKKIIKVVLLLFVLCPLVTGHVFALSSPDLNGDGCIDGYDLSILQSNFGLNNATLSEGDVDSDNNVDIRDVAVLARDWKTSCDTTLPCPALQGIVNTLYDASPTIQKCIDAAISSKTNKIVELPAGVYNLASQLRSTKATSTFRITTKGKLTTDTPCTEDSTDCAELRAINTFNTDGKSDNGLLSLVGKSIVIDHVVVNGNKQARGDSVAAARCKESGGVSGSNMSVNGNAIQILNSVSKNALCGFGLNALGKNILVKYDSFISNGNHQIPGMWANGVTSYENNDGFRVLYSRFVDNTGMHIQLGAALKQKVQHNAIQNSSDISAGAYAGIVLYDYGKATNNPTYADSVVSLNTIDCSATRNCGFGILLGSDPWSVVRPLHVTSATVNSNTITNAQVGILLDDASGNTLKSNKVTWTDANLKTTKTSCGDKAAGLYVMGSESVNNIFGNQKYTTFDFNGCIANWPF